MNNIIKMTMAEFGLISEFRNQKSQFLILQYLISQQNNQIFEISGLDCFVFTTSPMDKCFTQDILI